MGMIKTVLIALAGTACGSATVTAAAQCKMTAQPWIVVANKTRFNINLLLASDLSPDGSEKNFNMTSVSRSGQCPEFQPWQGSVNGNAVKLHIYAGTFGKDQEFAEQDCSGTFSADCTSIDWGSSGCLVAAPSGKPSPHPSPPNPNTIPTSWCGSYTSAACGSFAPPYGFGMSFWDVFDDNMVLQMEPAAAAVYGIATPSATAVAITVTEVTTQASYTVQAKLGMDAVQQPVGPQFAGMHGKVPGPYFGWKALLKPTAAGGNYTIFAECTGCTGTGEYSNATISNVAFGDVWHCSGQSNMWLPLSSSFTINATIGNITSTTAPKYRNIRMMAGNSGDGNSVTSNPWMTALQAASLLPVGNHGSLYRKIVDFGATCWYFAQKITDELEAAGKAVFPIGLTDTAIGGQRIEEYMVNDTSFYDCNAKAPTTPGARDWNGHLFASMTTPFVDMTVKGWLWYQGENNMGGVKGNSAASLGYACNQKALVAGWRKVWSATPGTTDPMAPFGIATLASSGSEGGPHMGAMRQAQTASYGVLPGPAGSGMENTFVAQVYDLDDEWGPAVGPCFAGYQAGRRTTGGWNCCPLYRAKGYKYNATSCTPDRAKLCTASCAAAMGTPSHGGIHPRSKKHVGDRLGAAGYSVAYGGAAAATGPTLAGCAVSSKTTMTVSFNSALLKGDKVTVASFPRVVKASAGGSQLYVQVNASNWCMEPTTIGRNATNPGIEYCPTWAGGSGPPKVGSEDAPRGAVAAKPPPPPPPAPRVNLDTQWIMLNYTLGADGASLDVDLAPLNGSAPTAVRYAWGIIDCCDYSDPDLYITHGCIANCPIMSSSNLPANPFMAKIVGGKCECIAPQVC